MKIAMLARNPNLYSHKRLVEAAEAKGHEIDIINTIQCNMNITAHRLQVIYQGESLTLRGYDAAIPRIGASITFQWVRAPCSGVVRAIKPIGARVKTGQILAIVSDPLGETETEIEAPVDGVIIGRTNLPLTHEGEALFNIGLTTGTQVVARTLDDFDPLEEYKSGATGELAETEPEIV